MLLGKDFQTVQDSGGKNEVEQLKAIQQGKYSQNSLGWKGSTRIIKCNYGVNSPYRDRTHNLGFISTMLQPTELIQIFPFEE